MLPFENENADEIRKHFQPYFVACQRMVEFAQQACTEFTQAVPNSNLNSRGASILAGMIVREGRKLRAISLLCERGFASEAHQLTRSAFDGALAARFVCMEPVPDHKRPKDAQAPNYPPIPTGVDPVNFRAYIYAGNELMQKARRADDPVIVANFPAERIALVTKQAKEFTAEVGVEWSNRLGKAKGYSGLSTKDLAANYEMDSFYLLYKELCNPTHANDALSSICFDVDGSTGLMWCGKAELTIPTTLQLAVGFVADTCNTVLTAVGLHDAGAFAYQLAVEINDLP